jgi:general stress protein 26
LSTIFLDVDGWNTPVVTVHIHVEHPAIIILDSGWHCIFKKTRKKTMDSINQQQPEKNRRDLFRKEAADKIRSLGEKAKTCFFCTDMRSGSPVSTRPMSVQKYTDDGLFWFLSASDSHKNKHIAEEPYVQLLFKGSDYSDFLTLYGEASITTDKNVISELWEPTLKTWFTEGIDDPRITAIRFEPIEGYYWDTKHSQMVAFAKQLIGAAIGKTLDDSIEGKLTP